MSSKFTQLLKKAAAGANRDPATVRLLPDHVGSMIGGLFVPDTPSAPLTPGASYFSVVIERPRLAKGRSWWTSLAPMAYAVASFSYAGEERDVPVVVGPDLLKAPGEQAPATLSIRSLPVIGAHPYVGGPVNLTMVLYEVPMTNAAQRILDAVGTVAGAIPVAPALSGYLPIAEAVVNGVGLLLDVGQTQPVVGALHGTGIGNSVEAVPGAFAIIADPNLVPQELWLVDGELRRGQYVSTATHVDDVDYLVYRLVGATTRQDARELPFLRPLHERIVRQASLPDDASWQTAKTALSELVQELHLSPDLTRAQAKELYLEFRDEAVALRQQAVDLAHLGVSAAEEVDLMMRNINSAVMAL